MNSKSIYLSILVVFLSTFFAASTYADNIPIEIIKKIKATLNLSRPDLKFGDVKRTKISGLYSIKVDSNQFLYVGETGEYLIAGDMYQAKPRGFVPVIPASILEMRINIINAISKDDMIIFPSSGEVKKVLYVFTDVDCHFCRKFHNDTLPDLNLSGIEVRYLAFPRAGIGSKSYKKMASAWCAEEKTKALSSLKNSEAINEYICDNDPVGHQYSLGKKIGITGTPAMLLKDGTLLMGHRPATELIKIMGSD